jgi:hypothetical protein
MTFLGNWGGGGDNLPTTQRQTAQTATAEAVVIGGPDVY